MNRQFLLLLLRLIGLLIVVTFSFLSYYYLGEFTFSELWSVIKLMAPSFLFTFYAIILCHKNVKSMGIEVIVIIYPLFYIFSMIISLLSIGFMMPIMGGLGGILAKVFFINHNDWKDKNSSILGLLGFIGPIVGLMFLFLLESRNIKNEGVFGIIIGFWQLFVGLGLIMALNRKPTKNNVVNF